MAVTVFFYLVFHRFFNCTTNMCKYIVFVLSCEACSSTTCCAKFRVLIYCKYNIRESRYAVVGRTSRPCRSRRQRLQYSALSAGVTSAMSVPSGQARSILHYTRLLGNVARVS